MIIKAGDTAPKAQGDLNADLTGATVLFRLKKLNGTFLFSRTATITDAATGLVEYQWTTPGDTNLLVPGAYLGEFVVTFADARVQRFPQRWNLEVLVREAAPAA